jgi:hypothetical protein
MNKFMTLAAAGVLAVGASAATATPSQAFFPWMGVGIAVGLAGLATGAAIAANHHGGVFDRTGADLDVAHSDHATACQNAYRSYDATSDTYVARISHGRAVRVPCTL